jgi:hypothetical protein
MDRLSCRSFAATAVRLQLHALAYNLGNCLRTLATPEPIKAAYVLALRGNQSALHDAVKSFFGGSELARSFDLHKTADTGHRRIEERTCRATDVIDGLKERHPHPSFRTELLTC